MFKIVANIESFLKKYKLLIYILLGVYSVLRLKFYYEIPAGSGDENIFIKDLVFMNENGIFSAIKKQVGITYLLLASPFSLFFKEYIALRIVNFLLLIVLVIYIKNRIPNLIYYVPFIFYIFTGTSFFIGTNDALFQVSLIVFFIETYNAINKRKYSFSLAFTSLFIAVFTREMYLVYIPIIFFSFFFWKKEELNFRKIIFPTLTFMILILINIPSFMVSGKPSYDDKNQGVSNNGWGRYQYLSQIKANEGVIKEGQHVGWEYLDKYIEEHGKESLPDGMIESLLFDPVLTIKEFFKDLFFSLFYSVRQQGIMLLVTFFYFFKIRKIKEIFEYNNYIPIMVVSMYMIFSFIIISYIELRWLVPVSTLSVVFFYDKISECKLDDKNQKIEILNNSLMILLMFFGIFNQVKDVFL